jgi:hypothetical protein
MNLGSNEYTIIDDTIIIHWEVNKPIGKIDEKFKKLIFSNYDNINLCIKKNNNFKTINYDNWMRSKFNQSIVLTNSLTHLTFGSEFNQKVILTDSLTHLTFGNNFNQYLNLTNSLTHLIFGWRFNQSIVLTNSLIHLTFGYKFNQQVTLTNSLTHFIIQQC